jgi:hypothetical protein
MSMSYKSSMMDTVSGDAPNPIDVRLLGEQVRRLQADVRGIRDDMKLLRSQLERYFEVQNDRLAAFEAHLDSRIDQLALVVFAIADKLDVPYRP